MNLNKKHVTFNNDVVILSTYAPDEYDRFPIDSILYQKMYLRVSDFEWNNMIDELIHYKKHEMIVHIENTMFDINLNK